MSSLLFGTGVSFFDLRGVPRRMLTWWMDTWRNVSRWIGGVFVARSRPKFLEGWKLNTPVGVSG